MGILVDSTIFLKIALGCLFCDLAYEDYQKREVTSLTIILTGLISLYIQLLKNELLISITSGLFIFSIFYVLWRNNPQKFGGGDVKVITVLAILYHEQIALIILIASALAISYMLLKKKKIIPYIPFLVLGVICQMIINIIR